MCSAMNEALARLVTSTVIIQRISSISVEVDNGKTTTPSTYKVAFSLVMSCVVHIGIQIMSLKTCHAAHLMSGFPDLRSGSDGANVVFYVFLGYYLKFVLCVIGYAD